MISNDELKLIASEIILSCGSDVEPLSIREMTEDYFEYGEGQDRQPFYKADREKYWNRINELIELAEIRIYFP